MITEQMIKENLEDAGISPPEIESIMMCIRTENIKQAEKLIENSRRKQLEKMHICQKSIDRLDYLRYQMKGM